MEKSLVITYNIADPGKNGSAVVKAVSEEIRRIHDAVKGPISAVVINCLQTGSKSSAVPTFEELMQLQSPLQIGEITVNKNYSNTESRSPQEILEELRRLHDEFGNQINSIEDDAGGALQNIHEEMETQLDVLEDALGDK